MHQEPQTPTDRAPHLLGLRLTKRMITTQRVWIIGFLVVSVLLLAIAPTYGRDLWDWLDLLVVPAVIAIGVVLIQRRQSERDEEAKLARQVRHEQEMEQRAQDEAPQDYLDKMSELLIDKKLHEKSDDYDVTRVTARAQTLAVLERLEDGRRKRRVLRFLREARLINRYTYYPEKGSKVIYYAHYVGLEDADLSGVNLEGARLISTNKKIPISLKRANLKCAKLSGAILRGADLSGADLSGADQEDPDLSGADLSGADLSKAILHDADLSGADLSGAKVSQEQLDQAESLEATIMPDGSKHP